MGVVVNKSFNRVRRDIDKKSYKLLTFLEDNVEQLSADWTPKQDKIYMKLSSLSYSLLEEINNLDEVDVPEYGKCKWLKG